MAKNVPTEPSKRDLPTPSREFSFGGLREEMNRLLDDFMDERMVAPFGVLREPWNGLRASRAFPRVDISENEKRVRVAAELPGMTEKDIELSIDDGVLTLRGQKSTEIDEKKEDVHRIERHAGAFQRSFSLPDTIDQAKVAASFKNGVLEVTIPKVKKAARASRKINIKTV